MEKKKGFSVLKFVIILLCIISVAATLTVNIAFAGGKTPKLMGKYVYVVKETDNMGDNLTVGAALLAPDAANVTLNKGDIVLCYPAAAPTELHVLSIFDIITAEDGTVYPLGSGTARPLKDYIETLRDAIDPALPLGLGEVPYGPLQVMHLQANTSALQEDTGWRPATPFEEGIRETIEWVRKETK